MIAPTKCPICKRPLNNEYSGVSPKNIRPNWEKRCQIDPNHYFYWVNDENEQVTHIEYVVARGTTGVFDVVWYPHMPKLKVYADNSAIDLPYFEPDFSDFPAVHQRVKTLLAFS